ncbi:MAG: hypothetical protein H6Q00_835 [Holophagaceae bacterium]|nr:hypothetical protein [Holophagaceae bacterium]
MPQHNWALGNHDLIWLDTRQARHQADLVIAIQQIRQLQNLALWAQQQFGTIKLAWWGHGRDFSKPRDAWSERFKGFLSRKAHWWFAYNNLSAQVVQELGFPVSRISSVMNTVDTNPLKWALERVTIADLETLRTRLGIKGSKIGIYIGALAPIKGLRYLLESCLAIRAQLPDFEMVMIGSGPEGSLVNSFAASHPWFHALPACFDSEKAPYLKLANAFLMPMGVGLGIIDTFVAGCPLVTTDYPGHGPEIDYLEHENNGIIVNGHPSPEAYARAVSALLSSTDDLTHLREGCRAAEGAYSMEAMVTNFATGILQALDAPPFHRSHP